MILNYLIVTLTIVTYTNSQEIIRCATGLNCPSHQPCCSDLGFCGSDEITCKLNCVPANSHNASSCITESSCQNQSWDFKDLGGSSSTKVQELATFQAKAKTGGGPKLSEVDFFTDGTTAMTEEGALLKMMKGSKGGSRMVSTAYLLYGNVSATLKTGRTGGVVTSFITMSKVHDEIDFEWVGSEVDNVQTNIFYRSQADHGMGGKSDVNSDTSQNFHDYIIEWTPDYIKWHVDGKVVRTLEKKQTERNGEFRFPSTPSRVEFGLWNGGSQAEGTRNWSGGSVNWDSEDIKNQGYFGMTIKKLAIICHPKFLKFGESGKEGSNPNHSELASDKSAGTGMMVPSFGRLLLGSYLVLTLVNLI